MNATHVLGRRPSSGAVASLRGSAAVVYDFRRPTKLSREHARVLQTTYETFARRLTTLFTSTLRQVCHISVVTIEQLNYDEYVALLSAPTIVVPFSARPLAGTALLQFGIGSAMASIDYLLGGPGGPQPARALTETETGLIGGLIDQIMGALRFAFEPIVELHTDTAGIEYNPQFVQVAGGGDALIVASFEMTIGTEAGLATLAMPLPPIVQRLAAQRSQRLLRDHVAPDADSQAMRIGMQEVPVDVSVRFRHSSIDSAALLTLRPGDVLPLGHRVSDPLSLQAGGVTFAHAVAGQSGTTLAALIVDTLPDRPHTSQIAQDTP